MSRVVIRHLARVPLAPTLAQALEVAKESGVGIYLHVKVATPEAIVRAVEGWSGAPLLVYNEYRWLRHLHLIAPDLVCMPELGSAPVRDLAHELDTRWF